MFAVPPSLRVKLIAAAVAAGAALTMSATSALADCQTDIQSYMKRRDSVIAQLRALQGPKGKKQLDPAAACPKFRSLCAILTILRSAANGHGKLKPPPGSVSPLNPLPATRSIPYSLKVPSAPPS